MNIILLFEQTFHKSDCNFHTDSREVNMGSQFNNSFQRFPSKLYFTGHQGSCCCALGNLRFYSNRNIYELVGSILEVH